MSYKLMASLAVATVSVAATGVVQAEEAVPVSMETDITNVEMPAQPEVTQAQVDDAKAGFNQANQTVVTQEALVNEMQSDKDQAQLAVVEASLAVTESQKFADQANLETIAQAQETVTNARQDVVSAEEVVVKEQESAESARQAVLSQESVVKDNQVKVTDAEKEVSQAQEAVESAKQAIDKPSTQVELVKAQEAVSDKKAKVTEAQTALDQAQKADALLEEKSAQAQENFSQRASEVQQAEFLLNKILVGMAKEVISTSFEDHAYYNQRDAIWAAYYGNGSFAATGCVPSVLAMVFTELERRGITPKQVADYLYNNTEYFNKSFSGTSAHGIVSASEHFGFVSTQLASQSAIVEALQAGHHVVGAVQNNKFSPWGGGYSHEIVMKGYSNGKTYIYDPYNRANIGWYPVASLWAEQSQDKDDSALGAPFFKITTQKMAELEAQKVKASLAVQTATRQLADAKATLTTLQSTALRVPGAQEVLNQATADLSQAEANVVKVQEAVHLASQVLAQKETNLKEAQAELSLKETALSEVKEVLVASQTKLEMLKATATAAEETVSQAKETLETAKQALVRQETRLAGLKEAPARLAKAQAVLMAAKTDLAQKIEVLKQAQVELETLKILASEAQTHYMTVLTAYQANLTKDHYTQLKTAYQKVVSDGGQIVPVVDETGKVMGIINGIPSHQVKTSTEVRRLASVATINRSLVANSDDILPSTGEESSALGMAGFSLISLLGLVGLKRKAKFI